MTSNDGTTIESKPVRRWLKKLFFGGTSKSKKAAGGGQSQAPTESVVSSEAYSGSTKELEGFSELEPEKEVSIPGSGRFICGYEILDTLGKGMSGKVKRGRSKEGKHVALKIIDKNSTPRRVLAMLNSEIQAMQTLKQHPHVLQLLQCDFQAVYPKKRGGVREVVCLALELAPHGELFDYLMYTGAFTEDIGKAIFQQMASALAFSHDHNIYHRDIKPENILLDEHYQIKVADFGLAAVRTDPQTLLKTECGTRSYMAPEVMARQQYDGKKADCWSVGVVLFIMLSGNPPFQMARAGDWWFDQLKAGRADKFWRSHLRYSPNFPKGAQDLITHVFNPDPATRPSVKDLLNHPWLASSSLTALDIAKELRKRRDQIAEAKAAEMAKAKHRKAAGKRGESKKDLDPDKAKHRDVPRGDVPAIALSEMETDTVKAPMATDRVLSCMTNLYSADRALYCLKRLRETVALMGGEILTKASEEESRFKMVAVVPADHMNNKVEVEIRLWSGPDGDITIIQVLRKNGDVLAFHKVFNKIRGDTKDLHGDDDEDDLFLPQERDPHSSDLKGNSLLDDSRGPHPMDDSDDEGMVRERPEPALSSEEDILDGDEMDMI